MRLRMSEVTRRAFLALIAAAPIAALAPWSKSLDRFTAGDVFTIAGHYVVNPPVAGLWLPFVTLPTTRNIVAMVEVDGYLCARTDDDTCWVIDKSGELVTSFQRPT